MVDLPAPDRPVNHRHSGRWPMLAPRTALSTSTCCQCTLAERVSAKSIMPQATVALLWRSIRMKPPSVRLAA